MNVTSNALTDAELNAPLITYDTQTVVKKNKTLISLTPHYTEQGLHITFKSDFDFSFLFNKDNLYTFQGKTIFYPKSEMDLLVKSITPNLRLSTLVYNSLFINANNTLRVSLGYLSPLSGINEKESLKDGVTYSFNYTIYTKKQVNNFINLFKEGVLLVYKHFMQSITIHVSVNENDSITE